MARGIITCTGVEINIGDRVRTPNGKIITVQGAAIGARFYNAEKCTKVKENEKDVPEDRAAAAAADDSDCVIWGS
jgi:hypothetical protein